MKTPQERKSGTKNSVVDRSVSNLQGRGIGSFQFVDNRPEAAIQFQVQQMASEYASNRTIQPKANNTGLPNQLKSGIENLSGFSMDDVKVHYNSSKPAQLQAHAYAQGTDIHIASGQEKHLPHEAWHVVQQKQGRVKPTMQLKGTVNINDDKVLEKEADVMGGKALHSTAITQKKNQNNSRSFGHTIQKVDNVINYGSGTSPETLMKSKNDHIDVNALNIDSGHMLLAEVIQECLINKDASALGKLTPILLAALGEKKTEGDLYIAAEEGNMSWMKHQYFASVDGFNGVKQQVSLLGEKGRMIFETKAKELSEADFALGDASTIPQNGQTDTIYCINGYGYSPLTDPNIFAPMAKSLKKGGQLIIISDIMGPTVKPFLEFPRKFRGELENLFYLTREENVITENPNPKAVMNIVERKIVRHLLTDKQPISRAFQAAGQGPKGVGALELFDFNLEKSTIYVSKSSALGDDILTMNMESRHTEGGTELAESAHVTLVFTRK